MSKKIKFSTFEIALLFGVAVLMIVSLFSYHHPETLSSLLTRQGLMAQSATLLETCSVDQQNILAIIQETYNRQLNLLFLVFGIAFILFWMIFVTGFYMLIRRNIRRQRKEIIAKVDEVNAKIDKVKFKLTTRLVEAHSDLEDKIGRISLNAGK
jgi:hypothetical protein